ncbi:hypothetical protein F442_07172, partial [Phytophthora nicotianae P10297]
RLLLVMAKLAKLVDRRGSHLEHRFGIIDGKTLMVHYSSNYDLHNAMYNGCFFTVVETGN